MCKIFALTSLKNIVVDNVLLDSVKKAVCKHNDKDGFGYAILDDKNNICGERTTKPLNFNPLNSKKGSKTLALPIVENSSNVFGMLKANPKSLIAHGRYSTNTISLENTHPFYNGNEALIHNGVVQDAYNEVTSKLLTDCDSEILLRHWEQGGIDSIERGVTGYYAMAVLDNTGILHIVRDDKAVLFIAWIKTIRSFAIATTQEIIKDICKDMKWEYEYPELILDNTYVVFDGNEIVSHRAIECLGYVPSLSKIDNVVLGIEEDSEMLRYSDLTDEDYIALNDKSKYA